jgi:hypothetical protein
MPTSCPCRRVVLDVVPRRDADQRLSLALCLLLREHADRSPPAVARPAADQRQSMSRPARKED